MQQFDKIIVSCTIIKSRLHLLKQIIMNMFEQTIRPNIIHIFYSSEPLYFDDGIDKKTIQALNEEIDLMNYYNVQVIFTETKNIGPYRKLLPALKIYKNDIIITIDDDCIFELTFIQKYIFQYVKNGCVICSGGKFYDIKNYNNNIDHSSILNINYTDKSVIIATNYIPQGCGGVLYHSKMFDTDFIDFDYSILPEIIQKNDDIFFRNYTFRKNIKVLILTIKRTLLLDIDADKTLYFDYNINIKTSQVLNEMKKLNFAIINEIQNIDDTNEYRYNINENEEIEYFKIQNVVKQSNRADIKLLQYEEHSHIKNTNTIDLRTLIQNKTTSRADLKLQQYEEYSGIKNTKTIDLNTLIQNNLTNKKTTTNCIVINIEKDIKRYLSAIEELKKISFSAFVHLKATFWKEKTNFVNDMNFVLEFLKQYNNMIPNMQFAINNFSESNDKNIKIQDGPLACYCSHVRALIYGYINFKDYTIICEDDIFIGNTEYIKTYIEQMPNDWDIICLNSKPINLVHDGPYYKFNDTFCSLHFYIVKNKCLPLLFKYLYPIYDQIDIIIGNLHKIFNIYNIINTVYQKNFSTNTQNNLNIIMNTPGYEPTRIMLKKIHSLLTIYINKTLPNNENYNNKICSNIISDVLYDYIMNNASYIVPNDLTNIDSIDDVDDFDDNECKEFTELFNPIYLFIKYCVKGINTRKVVFSLLNDIKHICESFDMHNNGMIKAYNYGSSSNVYINGDVIIKKFNTKIRWQMENHDDYLKIYNKEIAILKKIYKNNIVCNDLIIIMPYFGISLYDKFYLPDNWRQQINSIFNCFDDTGIYYPEFNIKNIVIKNDIITFIDYGLALINGSKNDTNRNNFIELLNTLQEQFRNMDSEKLQIQYMIFINNIKNDKGNKYECNVF
jgi:hypothetical protein